MQLHVFAFALLYSCKTLHLHCYGFALHVQSTCNALHVSLHCSALLGIDSHCFAWLCSACLCIDLKARDKLHNAKRNFLNAWRESRENISGEPVHRGRRGTGSPRNPKGKPGECRGTRSPGNRGGESLKPPALLHKRS